MQVTLTFLNTRDQDLYSRSVAYAKNSHGWVSFSCIWWSFVFGVRFLWSHDL